MGTQSTMDGIAPQRASETDRGHPDDPERTYRIRNFERPPVGVPPDRVRRYQAHRLGMTGRVDDEGEPTGGAVAWVLIVFAFLAVLFGPGLIALACGQVFP